MKCMQSEGDLLYVPAHWSHSVVNHGEVIAISGLDVFEKLQQGSAPPVDDPGLLIDERDWRDML